MFLMLELDCFIMLDLVYVSKQITASPMLSYLIKVQNHLNERNF